MLGIMMIAFASFFKIMNKNTPGIMDEGKQIHYVDEYIGQN